eukprot:924018-Ditylum_brightwellii.AAC.1
MIATTSVDRKPASSASVGKLTTPSCVGNPATSLPVGNSTTTSSVANLLKSSNVVNTKKSSSASTWDETETVCSSGTEPSSPAFVANYDEEIPSSNQRQMSPKEGPIPA